MQHKTTPSSPTPDEQAGERSKALSRETADLRTALDEHAIVSIADPQGKIIYVNDRFCAISGYSRQELIGQDHRIINSGHHPKEFIRDLWATITHGRTWHGEMKNKAKDGSFYWVDATIVPFHNEHGKPTRYVSIRTDITERKQIEEALAAERTLLRTLFDLLPDYIYVKDEQGRFLACNDRCARCMGAVSPEEVIGRTDADFYPAELAAQFRADELTVLAGTPLIDKNENFTGPDGQSQSLLTTKLPRRDRSGKIIGIVGTGRDISEQILLEEKFRRAQRLEAIGTLASGVAHDLNNILTPMLMAAGMLKDKLPSARDREILAMVEKGAQRGASIIGQLLTFSRGIEGARVSIQLRHLLKEMGLLMRETFPRGIEIKQSVPHELWTVLADATQMHQVFMNLCVNARDAMPHGGKLTVSAENIQLDGELAQLHAEAKPGPHVVVTVADTGTGIPPEIIQRIFDPFFTTKGIGKGTGLGLSTVVGIVKSHGGFITVYTEPGRGTAFKVYLPATGSTGSIKQDVSKAPIPIGNEELILVVDDEAPILLATSGILTKYHYRVLTAGSGEEAVRLFIQHCDSVGLVLTDIMMPGIGGAELVRSLRIIKPEIKVIATSGLEQEENRSEFTALGVTVILPKPCMPAILLKAVNQVLQEKR